MPIWFLFSFIFVWMIVKGRACIFIFAGDIVMMFLCFRIQIVHPEYVKNLSSVKVEFFDTFVSCAVVTLFFGVTFKMQSRLYKKKQQELIKKDQELIETNIRLDAANRAKSDFLAKMSHEIRTPINAILGMDEMILRESTEKNILGYADSIEGATNMLLSTVNDILDFSKIESGMLEIIPEEYELFSLIKGCVDLIEMRASKKGLNFIVENDPDMPTFLYGDKIRIHQIICNFLTNAVKYTPKGEIRLEIDFIKKNSDTANVVFSIKDTGKGIAKEDFDKLFSSFTRIDEKNNKNIEGTGLGLAITKQLVDLMGGKIDVESKLGKGSSFTVVIPQKVVSWDPMGNYSDRNKAEEKSNKNYQVSFYAPKARILIVDDVKLNLDVAKLLLKKTGIKIDTASSGDMCLEMFSNNHYDILFLDHMMPGMDGIEALKNIKSSSNMINKETPVIVLTANAILGAQKEYIAAGFTDYLSKPIRADEIERMILKYLPDSLVEKRNMSANEVKDKIYNRNVFDSVKGLDVSKGISFCDNDFDTYVTAVKGYVNGDNRYELICKYFEAKDYDSYRVEIHALKGASYLIGADHIGDIAAGLEAILSEGLYKDVDKNHYILMEQYKNLIDRLKQIVEG